LRLSEIKTWRPASGNVYFDALYAIGTAGNIQQIKDLRPGPRAWDRTQKFAYDAFDQLTHAEGFDDQGAYAHEYRYDAAGNLVLNPMLASFPLVYAAGGASNRLLGFDDGIGIVRLFDYDANGNMTTMPGRTLLFDPKQ